MKETTHVTVDYFVIIYSLNYTDESGPWVCYLGDISLHKDFVAIGSYHFRLAVLIVYFLAHVLSRKQTLLISLVDEIF